jgi:hypothetical protein
MVEQASRPQMQLSTRLCLRSVHNFKSSAVRGLDDSQVDARGKLDFQLVKDIVEQGHVKAQAMMQQDLDRILHRVKALQSTKVTAINNGNTKAIPKEYRTYARNTVVGIVVPITACLDALK